MLHSALDERLLMSLSAVLEAADTSGTHSRIQDVTNSAVEARGQRSCLCIAEEDFVKVEWRGE